MASPTDSSSDHADTASSMPGTRAGGDGALTVASNGSRPLANLPARPPILSLSPRPVDLFHALRRRWAWVLGLGTLLVTAAVLLAVWLVPVKYTATAWVRIAGTNPTLVFDNSKRNSSLLDHRRSQATLITMPLVLQPALRDPAVSQLPIIRRQRDPVRWLRENLRVSFPGNSDLLQISLTAEDPNQASKIVEAVREAYFNEVVNRDREAQQKRVNGLQAAYDLNRLQVKNRTDVVNKLAEDLGTVDSEAVKLARLRVLEDRSALKGRVNDRRAEIQGIERRINLLKIRLDKEKYLAEHRGGEEQPGDENAKSEGDDTEALELAEGKGVKGEHQGEEAEAKKKREQRMFEYLMQAAYTRDPSVARAMEEVRRLEETIEEEKFRAADSVRENLPSVVRLQERLDARMDWLEERREEMRPYLEETVRDQMARGEGMAGPTAEEQIQAQIEQLENDKVVLEEEKEVAMEDWNEAVKEEESITSGSLDLEQKREELERFKKIGSRIGAELDEAKVELAAAPRVTRLDLHTPKTGNVQDKIWLVVFIGLGTFGACVLGIAAIDFASRRINSPSEVAYGLGVRVMGNTPMVSGRSWRLQRGFNGAPLAGYQGMMAESIDNIRTALLHSSHAESIHTVMITSSLEKEGKSTVASQLAASLARSGRRTLLIDGDLRRPTLHQLFELPQDPGLCELLREEVDLEDVVRPTRVAGLWLVSAGRVDQEAVQSLAQEGLREPFVRLREEFDFVLIDAGPVLTDADALLFGQYVDGVILSILRDVSQVPRVFEACERLRSVDLRLLGAVVNGVSWGRYRSYYRPYSARVDEPAAV